MIALGALVLLAASLLAAAPASAGECYCGDGLTPILGCCGGDGDRACIVESVFSDCDHACQPGHEQLVLALGASCYRPRQVGESCGPGFPCAEDAICAPIVQQCFPSDSVGVDVLAAPICDAFYVETVSDAVQLQAAWDLSRGYHSFGLDLSFVSPDLGGAAPSLFDGLVAGSRQFGIGAAAGAVVGATTEFGVSYGKDGDFGCYVTDCLIAGGVLSAGFNACTSVNVVEADAAPGAALASLEGESWNAFADAGEVITVGGSFGFNSLANAQAAGEALISTAQHPVDLQSLSDAAPDAYSQCVGVGVGSPVNAGLSACLTLLVRTRSPGLPPTVEAGGDGYGDVVLRGASVTLGVQTLPATWSFDATEFRWDIGNDGVYDTTKLAETWTNSPFSTWTFDGPEFDRPQRVTAKLYARNATGQTASSPRSYFVVPCAGPPDADGDGIGDACDGCDSVDNRRVFYQDPDHDGVWDTCDPCWYDPDNDSDGDGVCGGAKIGSCRMKTAADIFTGKSCRRDDDCTALDPETFCYGVAEQRIGLCSNRTPAGGAFNVILADCTSDSDCRWYAAYPKCSGVEFDNCPTPNAPDANGLQADSDGDAWGDACDNCPQRYNPDQDPTDSDTDGTPDACDPCRGAAGPNSDNDSICDRDDNCDTVDNEDQSDLNGDGIGDRCEQIAAQRIGNAAGGFEGALVSFQEFGRALARIGDLDGNGVSDLAVGVPFCDDGVSDGGCVWILFLNAQGTVIDEQKISATAGGFGGGIDATDMFGNAIAGLGDLDGDGVPDLAVGGPGDDDDGGNVGAVRILFLRRDGTVKAKQKITPIPPSPGARFGAAVAAIGDTDGDGIGDLAVGAPGAESVWIVSLRTDGSASSSRRLTGITTGLGDNFGFSVAPLGDLDGDGVSELAVGAIGSDSPFEPDAGAVYILSFEPDGSVDRFTKLQANSVTIGPTSPDGVYGGLFGRSVQSLGDLDGDGFVDLAVGAPAPSEPPSNEPELHERAGEVQVLFLEPVGWTIRDRDRLGSGANPGTPFRQLLATLELGDYFGVSLAALGDLDGNGTLELAVGASRDDSTPTFLENFGAVWIVHYPGAPSVCGNRVLDPAEECDDGAALAGDGCSAACKLERFIEVSGSAAGGRIFVTLDGVRVFVDTELGDDAGSVARRIQEALAAAGLGDRVSIRFGSQLWLTGGASVATYDPGLFLSTSPTLDPANVALASRGGVASQSSTLTFPDSNPVASKANDGDRNGDFFDDSVAHTNLQANPYWEVSLAGGSQAVGRVVVFNRTDGEPVVAARINPFTVELRKAGLRVAGFDGQTFMTDIAQPNVAGMVFDFGGVVGDTVRVSLPGRTQHLHLAEVEVYGVPEIEPRGACSAGPSTARVCYEDVDCAPSCSNGGAACRDEADCLFGTCFTGGGACGADADCSSLKICNDSQRFACQSDADCLGSCSVHGFGACQRDFHCEESVNGTCNPTTGLCEGAGSATGFGCVDSIQCFGTVRGVCVKSPGVCRSGLDFCMLTDQGSCNRSAQCIPEPGGALLAAAAIAVLTAIARSRGDRGRYRTERANPRA